MPDKFQVICIPVVPNHPIPDFLALSFLWKEEDITGTSFMHICTSVAKLIFTFV